MADFWTAAYVMMAIWAMDSCVKVIRSNLIHTGKSLNNYYIAIFRCS